MLLHVLAVRDRSADVFGQPSFHVNIGAAARAFSDEINRVDANNIMNRHPSDFDLYELGSYDDNTGTFECLKVPRMVLVGKDCVRA